MKEKKTKKNSITKLISEPVPAPVLPAQPQSAPKTQSPLPIQSNSTAPTAVTPDVVETVLPVQQTPSPKKKINLRHPNQ